MNSIFVSETMQEVFENLMNTPTDHLREMLDNARDMGISSILENKKAIEAADTLPQSALQDVLQVARMPECQND
ncbi:hypothetical protein [Candidatus Magnetominusculus xianensis]|uniref:Uncharacterized protein n=1 Tax=Candidatus Magnetominusculus xianensis TaxID=1748249 RepID=A0ABR5SFY8_9BACT|nr:hypothetical protein [Candidatus Magnetominusculus xianensis]KWT86931.1 hypothetical protein ASN18_1403 [Candidatus Magnetominusculus xianensis]